MVCKGGSSLPALMKCAQTLLTSALHMFDIPAVAARKSRGFHVNRATDDARMIEFVYLSRRGCRRPIITSCDVVLSMSSTLYRHLYLSAVQRIRNVMTLQHLSTRAGPQPVCQHTLRTAAGLANARGIPLARPCLHFVPSAQLHFSRALFSRSGLLSLSASQAQQPETTDSEDRPAGSDLVESSDLSTQQTAPAAELQQTFPGVQADSGVEVVSEAIPTEAVLSASVTESNGSPAVEANASAESSAVGTPGEWESILQAFLDIVIEGNYFEGRPPKADAFSISVLKRGILNFARARQDILFSLPEEKIRAVLAAGPPYQERKVELFLAMEFALLLWSILAIQLLPEPARRLLS